MGICPSCQKEYRDKVILCPECGELLQDLDDAAQPAPKESGSSLDGAKSELPQTVDFHQEVADTTSLDDESDRRRGDESNIDPEDTVDFSGGANSVGDTVDFDPRVSESITSDRNWREATETELADELSERSESQDTIDYHARNPLVRAERDMPDASLNANGVDETVEYADQHRDGSETVDFDDSESGLPPLANETVDFDDTESQVNSSSADNTDLQSTVELDDSELKVAQNLSLGDTVDYDASAEPLPEGLVSTKFEEQQVVSSFDGDAADTLQTGSDPDESDPSSGCAYESDCEQTIDLDGGAEGTPVGDTRKTVQYPAREDSDGEDTLDFDLSDSDSPQSSLDSTSTLITRADGTRVESNSGDEQVTLQIDSGDVERSSDELRLDAEQTVDLDSTDAAIESENADNIADTGDFTETLASDSTDGTGGDQAGTLDGYATANSSLEFELDEPSGSTDSSEGASSGQLGDLDFELGNDSDTHISDEFSEGAGDVTLDVEGTINADAATNDKGTGRETNLASYDTHLAGASRAALSRDGRLQQLWQGIADSDENPMRSLQSVRLEASDAIFDRVATRKVARGRPSLHSTADYQVIRKLGEGAMGVVLSAHQAGVERVVAIKTAKPNYQKSDESRRRFLYEAQITAELGHSNIVPIYELGASEDGMLFYSMKLVEGTPWNQAIRKTSREDNLEIFMKVCDAMAFAHSKGVIHRDLKPENTMLGTYGEVFVTDWGTAIDLGRDSSTLSKSARAGDSVLDVADASGFRKGDSIFLTDGNDLLERRIIDRIEDGNHQRIHFKKRLTRAYRADPAIRVVKQMTMAGTPCYMAPEMAGHQLEKIGPASDIYLLGAMLFEIVTGKAPHQGKSIRDCLKAAVRNNAIEVESGDALLPIAVRAMATDPQDRYQSVEQLQDAVREYRQHSESIVLSKRSDRLLADGMAHQDYQAFSRAIFGYQDALELWDGNESARKGLDTARLSLGEVAFGKADYDLVLQTLDQSVEPERALYEKAVEAKQKSEQREAKVKLLQRSVAVIVLTAVAGLSALAFWALLERDNAFQQEAIAKFNEQQAKTQTDLAQKKEAEARTNGIEADRQRSIAEDNATEARNNLDEANRQRDRARENEQKAIEQTELALQRQREANQARIAEANARSQAQRRAAQIQLREYQSTLALAKTQIESFDSASAIQKLRRLRQPQTDVFGSATPAFNTWGWRRLWLLSNAGLPKLPLQSAPRAVDFAASSRRVAVANPNGAVQILEVRNGVLSPVHRLDEVADQVHCLALSEDGSALAMCRTVNGQVETRYWNVAQPRSVAIPSAQRRRFQGMSFSFDGRQLFAGINSGIWAWNVTSVADEFAKKPFKRIGTVRGSLRQIQPLPSGKVFFAAVFDDRWLLGTLNPDAATSTLVDLDEKFEDAITAAACTGRERSDGSLEVAIGLQDRSLILGWVTESRLTQRKSMPVVHQAEISNIRTAANRMVTSSRSEPVVHCWNLLDDEWNYDTFVSCASDGITEAAVLRDGLAAGIDQNGNAIVWNIDHQKRNRQVGAFFNDRNVATGLEPIRSLQFTSGVHREPVLSLDENGAVSRWSPVDGQSLSLAGGEYSFVGHSPGSQLINVDIDSKRRLIVTACSLSAADRRYLAASHGDLEVCVWDIKTGEMRSRWQVNALSESGEDLSGASENLETRISLLGDGELLLLASDRSTRIVETMTGKSVLRRDDFGSYFAVPHPQDSAVAMLVKRSGAIRILDTREPNTWSDLRYRNFELADPSAVPLRGVWSPDGERFYLSFSTGGLSVFKWYENNLQLLWSNRSTPEDTNSEDRTFTQTERTVSPLDIDLSVLSSKGTDVVHRVVRSRGGAPKSRWTAVEFDFDGGPTPIVDQTIDGVGWLHSNRSQASMQTKLHDKISVDSNRIVQRVQIENECFLATSQANVIHLVDGESSLGSFGRPRVIDTTASCNTESLYCLLDGGALWHVSAETGQPQWTRWPTPFPQAESIEVSGDGAYLAVQFPRGWSIYDANSQQMIQEWPRAKHFSWDTMPSHDYVVVDGQGEWKFVTKGETRELQVGDLITPDQRVVNIFFFRESWANADMPELALTTKVSDTEQVSLNRRNLDENAQVGDAPNSIAEMRKGVQKVRRHVLVHLRDENQDLVYFLPLDPLSEPNVPSMDRQTADAASAVLPVNSQICVSPKEGIFASGAPSGTLSIWYASPSWDAMAGSLFELESHRGAAINVLRFTSDGNTLLSGDTQGRVFAWPSQYAVSNTDVD